MDWFIVIGAIVAFLAIGLLFLNAAPGGAPRKLKRAFAPTTMVTEESQLLELVGEAQYQPALVKIMRSKGIVSTSVKFPGVLSGDPHVAHDALAVKAEVNGKTIGHLDVGDAKAFQKYLRRKGAQSVHVSALVHRATHAQTRREVYTVSIEVPEDWLD